MFKRVEKRRRKQEEEEALGLTEEMKEVLGNHDTDSDESMSSEDDDDDSDGAGEDEEDESGSEDGGANEEDESDQEGDEVEDDDLASVEDDSGPSIPVSVALHDPLYIISLDPDVQGCIVCPGKVLKNPIMIKVHKESAAHVRRYIRFVKLASRAPPEDDARKYIQSAEQDTAPATAKELSKRAAKRKAKLAKLKNKREQQKVRKAKAAKKKTRSKDEQDTVDKDTPATTQKEGPQAKRRKVDNTGDTTSIKSANRTLTTTKRPARESAPQKATPKSAPPPEGDQATEAKPKKEKKKRANEATNVPKTKKNATKP